MLRILTKEGFWGLTNNIHVKFNNNDDNDGDDDYDYIKKYEIGSFNCCTNDDD